MADLISTRVFGRLTVMHDAILKANAELKGDLNAGGVVSSLEGLIVGNKRGTSSIINIDGASPAFITFWENETFGMSFGYDGTGAGADNKLVVIAADGSEIINFFNDGKVTATAFEGDGSGLTGTASLRATGTTAADVGLGKVSNVASYSKIDADARFVQKGVFDLGTL